MSKNVALVIVSGSLQQLYTRYHIMQRAICEKLSVCSARRTMVWWGECLTSEVMCSLVKNKSVFEYYIDRARAFEMHAGRESVCSLWWIVTTSGPHALFASHPSSSKLTTSLFRPLPTALFISTKLITTVARVKRRRRHPRAHPYHTQCTKFNLILWCICFLQLYRLVYDAILREYIPHNYS